MGQLEYWELPYHLLDYTPQVQYLVVYYYIYTHILQIYWICKDAIDLTSRWKLRSILDKLFFKMKCKGCFISWYLLHTLLIISEGFTALQTLGLFNKQKKTKCVPITTIVYIGVSQVFGASESAPWTLEAPGLHDSNSNLNTLSTLTPRGQELLEHIKKEWQIKMMALFFFTAHEKGFRFHAQPQTGAYSCLLHFSLQHAI